MFGIIQGLYIVREDEEAEREEKRRKKLQHQKNAKRRERELKDGSGRKTKKNQQHQINRDSRKSQGRERPKSKVAQPTKSSLESLTFCYPFYCSYGISRIFLHRQGKTGCEQSFITSVRMLMHRV